jgi:predicted Zn finger-like uncharacterized protein
MNIRCPQCQTLFRVDPARIPAAGIRARCSRCATTFHVTRGNAAADAAARAPQPGPQQPTPAGPVEPTPSVPSPAEAVRTVAGAAMDAARTVATGVSAAVEAARDAAAGAGSRMADAAGTGDAPSPAAAGPRADAPAPAAAQAPAAATQPAAAQAPLPPAVAPPRPREVQPPQVAPDRPAAAGSTTPGAPIPQAARDAAGPRPPVFGSRDPDARAQRIARALISDIVAYHPQRREASLAAGSLRTDFREEIMKSWEEYVAQVGLETARSTPHFRNALNQILAQGQQVF